MIILKERIKKIRKELDLTQQKFSDKIGVKRNTIAMYEMGKTVPSEQTNQFAASLMSTRNGYALGMAKCLCLLQVQL